MEGERPACGIVKTVVARISARRTAVNSEDSVVDDGGQREEVEHVRKVRPYMGRAVFSHAFRVKTSLNELQIRFDEMSRWIDG